MDSFRIVGLVVAIAAIVAFLGTIPLAFLLARRGDPVPPWMRIRTALVGLATATFMLFSVLGWNTSNVVFTLFVFIAVLWWSIGQNHRYRLEHGGGEKFQQTFDELARKVEERKRERSD